ncbi:MAG: membrane-bound O-acyltransferase family protein [Flavobacteriales bacterium]|nr:membrane-bound O-acyltransferase family protein [Flavobacteriales bacterium]|tara:strand:- start:5239 stop:6663 length:1425 start_codon:yes stop_codon:yes gene_type:complete
MLFNTFEFLLFFLIVFVLFFSFPQKRRWVVLLASSYFFYGYWKPGYLILIASSTISDYFISNAIYKLKNQKTKKNLLFLSISLNLSLLFLFKYFDFIAESFNDLSGIAGSDYKLKLLNLILPVGISFYTFQTMSYTIDVYNGKLKPEKHFGIFSLFVAFFPQLVAGPIERASNLLPQFHKKTEINYDRFASGAQLILWGLVKKIIIADRVGIVANEIFNSYQDYHGFTLIIGVIFFAFQIYCDFSGYSDIAIGTARVFGYDLIKNFNSPYFSISLTDFWRRWHISLSTWFKDYVYIPLGGNRTLKWRWYFNLWITFLISGLWHGANWTFVLWGAIHGFGLILENMLNLSKERRFNLIRKLWIFGVVCLGWIFFRANSIEDALEYISKIFILNTYSLEQISPYIVPFAKNTVFSMDFILGYFTITMLLLVEHHLIIKKRWKIIPGAMKVLICSIATTAIFIIGVFEMNEFIYFQF